VTATPRRRRWAAVAHTRRHQLAASFGWVCAYCIEGLRCGRCGTHDEYEPTVSDDRSIATADHVIPIELGGTDDIDKLVLACGLCNSSKGVQPRLTIADEMGWK
jgi:5-methylcytosine-specific restriction endonuclease McrA